MPRTFTSASSVTVTATPAEARSAAMSVRASHAPLANVQKSSPGFTPAFWAVRSTPKRPNFAVAGADCVNTGTADARRATLTPTPIRAFIFMSNIPSVEISHFSGILLGQSHDRRRDLSRMETRDPVIVGVEGHERRSRNPGFERFCHGQRAQPIARGPHQQDGYGDVPKPMAQVGNRLARPRL